MVEVNKSAKLYQQRKQPEFPNMRPGPGPQVYLPKNPVHSLNLEPPALNAAADCLDCNKPTDGKTQVWPYGDKYAV